MKTTKKAISEINQIKLQVITIQDLKPGSRVQLESGTIFIIESVDENKVVCSLEGGTKGNYRNETNDAVLFFNEENAVIL